MNPEELKLVLEAVANTTGDAKHAFFAWLLVELLKSAGAVALLWLFITSVRRLLGGVMSHGNVSRKIAEHIGVDPDCDRSSRENREIHNWVDRQIATQKGASDNTNAV